MSVVPSTLPKSDVRSAAWKGFEMADQEVPLDRIDVDPDIQPRTSGLDASHVRTLEEGPDAWDPITVIADGVRYTLIDGAHRLAAAQNLELETIRVQVVPVPPDGDLHALSFDLNAKHGRPLTLADRRAFAGRMLAKDPHASNMEASRRTGLSPTTVQSIRERMEAGDEIPVAATRIGRDGATYPIREPGALPEPGLMDSAKNLLSSAERRNQRRIVQYLVRLAAALEDQFDIAGWQTHGDATDACVAVLGDEEAETLGARLGPGASNVLQVAQLLGYEESDD